LKHHVDDDRFLQIFEELSKVVRASARRHANAEDVMAEDDDAYQEEILGISFVLVQAKFTA